MDVYERKGGRQVDADEVPTSVEAILDAAERRFAELGFAGAGMKSIATAAGVAQGLLYYHFGSKEELYRAVVCRRSGAINAERRARMATADIGAPDALEQILRAYLGPPLSGDSVGLGYPRIFASLVAGTALDQQLVSEFYDEIAREVIALIRKAEPALDAEAAAWGYSLSIGALVSALSSSERVTRLGCEEGGDGAPAGGTDAALENIVTFAAEGFRALARRT